jgi:hypothetical protein
MSLTCFDKDLRTIERDLGGCVRHSQEMIPLSDREAMVWFIKTRMSEYCRANSWIRFREADHEHVDH